MSRRQNSTYRETSPCPDPDLPTADRVVVGVCSSAGIGIEKGVGHRNDILSVVLED